MKVPELALGVLIGLVFAGLISFHYRWHFVRKLKKEPLNVQAQYKIERIKSLLEAYE